MTSFVPFFTALPATNVVILKSLAPFFATYSNPDDAVRATDCMSLVLFSTSLVKLDAPIFATEPIPDDTERVIVLSSFVPFAVTEPIPDDTERVIDLISFVPFDVTDPIPDYTERVIDLMPLAVFPTSLETLVVALFKTDSTLFRGVVLICIVDVSLSCESSSVADKLLK